MKWGLNVSLKYLTPSTVFRDSRSRSPLYISASPTKWFLSAGPRLEARCRDSSELHVRTSKIVVVAVQHEVVDMIRKRDVDCLGDAEALQALKDFVLKMGASGSDLGNLQWFRGASAEAVNPFEEPEVPRIVSPVGHVVCVAKRNGVRRLHHASLCGTSKSSSTTMICRSQRSTTKFVANAGRMGWPR